MPDKPMRQAKIVGCISTSWEYCARDLSTDAFIGYTSPDQYPVPGIPITITHDGRGVELPEPFAVMVDTVDESAWN